MATLTAPPYGSIMRTMGSSVLPTSGKKSLKVSCQGIRKHFDGARAVDGVSLEAAPGEILAVVGPSGCGKTTLLRLLAGFEAPDSGVVQLGDQVVAGNGIWVPPEGRHVGMVFQDYALFPHMTVAQNVGFGLDRRWDREAKGRRVRQLLDMVHLAGLDNRRPYQLSGGEQQRVALVRSLAPHPVALFLDEPFSNLDPKLRVELREEVKTLVRDFGVTTVHVTHDQEEALFMGDRVAVMSQGKLEHLGTPEEVYHRPRTRFTAYFMGIADFLPAKVTSLGLQTELGLLDKATGFPLGAQVDMLVRPDQVSIKPCQEGPGRVELKAFRGLDYLYTLSLPSGVVLHTVQHHSASYEVGDRVQVMLLVPDDEPVCFAADGDAASV